MEERKLIIDVSAPGFQEFENTMSTPDQIAIINQAKRVLKSRKVTFEPKLGTPPSAEKANRLLATLKEITKQTSDLSGSTAWIINGQQIIDQLITTPENAEGIHLEIDYKVSV